MASYKSEQIVGNKSTRTTDICPETRLEKSLIKYQKVRPEAFKIFSMSTRTLHAFESTLILTILLRRFGEESEESIGVARDSQKVVRFVKRHPWKRALSFRGRILKSR